MPAGRTWIAVFLLLQSIPGPPSARAAEANEAIDFDREIRPILSDFCYACHGPDDASREADLRLDQPEGLFRQRDGITVVSKGNPNGSELSRRIRSTDPGEKMPPPEFTRQLSMAQVDLLQQWIEQGAPWQPHWSFVTPVRPPLPQVEDVAWIRNPIDAFVLASLESEGLVPAPRASRTALIRRITLDLTGLPPTPEEVDAFLNDEAPGAYERLVDRLLASPAYGERMAVDWLDGARYADTSGYQNDGPRFMWRWRDWVIDAFNRNHPFDQFTIEQIAGDLLPNATVAQRIATGFQRNHRGNAEGGIIPEEYAVEYVVDRVETTSTVWLGLTLGCARCHDHKYDPVRQKEFYQLYAFFNSVPEFGRAIKEGNSPPYIAAPTDEQREQLDSITQQLAEARERRSALASELANAEVAWQQQFHSSTPIVWSPNDGLVARYCAEPDSANNDQYSNAADVAAAFVGGPAEYCSDGAAGSAIRLDGERHVELGDVGTFGYFDKFTLSAWIRTDAPNGTILSRMTDAAEGDGYSLVLSNGRLQLNLVKRWLDDAIRVETAEPIPQSRWIHVAATYDGSRRAAGIQLVVNGQVQPMRVLLDLINQSFATAEPLRVGAGHGPKGRLRGDVDEVHIYRRVLSADELLMLGTVEPLSEVLAMPADQRTAAQKKKLSAYFLEHHAPEHLRAAEHAVRDLERRRTELIESFPTVMVMEDISPPRPTFVLARGQYDRPTESVERDVPACLPPFGPDRPRNRLGLAQWLVAPEQPLTARVIVNRYWQLLFGVGLVKTSEDFGLQGERPSHPELLDWLAVEFQHTGWDLKQLLRLIVTSSTYQQSSYATDEIWQRDPENRLLARGPRFRMNAEMLRDQMLAAAGLLDRRLGGPSVKPYQPDGLWREIATDTDYHQSHGADLYRRSLYTYWKRTVSPPTMAALDAPSRETCIVRRARTNTPLQALALMNETGHLEAARHLAARAFHEADVTAAARVAYMFRLLTARSPSDRELAVLLDLRHAFADRYRADPQSAVELLAIGETPAAASVDPTELATDTVLASLILNLDEVVTKE